MATDVFLVDDDDAVRDSLQQALELSGLTVRSFGGARAALDALGAGDETLALVTDVRLGGSDGDGLDLMGRVRALDAQLPVIVLTGHGGVAMAVQAMRDGAHDFIEKPFSPARLATTARRAVEQRRLVLENRALRQQIERADDWGIVGHSAPMRELRRLVTALAPLAIDVLLLGETGTGKEVVARALHSASGRRGPFVAINCGAVPETVFESEIFGHEAGAFTGAQKRRIGKIEHAQGGTLFLDEIESMPVTLQAKLLRTIQERCIERLGSNQAIAVDCRIVAASKVDLLEAAERGQFRADLYYRLEVATLKLPPLRERVDDIPLLFRHFVAAAAQRHNIEAPPWSSAELLGWQQRPWPGNVRELRNVAERWCLGLESAPAPPAPTPTPSSLSDTVVAAERQCIVAAMRAHRGNVHQAAEQLGVPRKTLYDKLGRLGIDTREFRNG